MPTHKKENISEEVRVFKHFPTTKLNDLIRILRDVREAHPNHFDFRIFPLNTKVEVGYSIHASRLETDKEFNKRFQKYLRDKKISQSALKKIQDKCVNVAAKKLGITPKALEKIFDKCYRYPGLKLDPIKKKKTK